MSKIHAMNRIKKNWIKLIDSVTIAWIKRHKFISVISVLAIIVFIFILCLFFSFDSTMLFIGADPEKIQDIQWEIIKNVGYAFGILLFIIQISISNRRADAAEETAKATLSSSVEQRYHNAINHLAHEKSVIRIGGIYNLYHISQNTDTYDQTIFDMFCEYLKDNDENIILKEKEIIVDKLFKVEKDKRVLKDLENIDLRKVDLTGINLTGAYLKKAYLKETVLKACIFDKADLTEAELPAELDIISMHGATMDNVNFSTSSNLQGLQFKQGFCRNANFYHTNLSNSDLSGTNLENTKFTGTNLENTKFTGTNFTNTTGLTFEQLSKTKNLHEVKGLSQDIEDKLRDKKPELFVKPTSN